MKQDITLLVKFLFQEKSVMIPSGREQSAQKDVYDLKKFLRKHERKADVEVMALTTKCGALCDLCESLKLSD